MRYFEVFIPSRRSLGRAFQHGRTHRNEGSWILKPSCMHTRLKPYCVSNHYFGSNLILCYRVLCINEQPKRGDPLKGSGMVSLSSVLIDFCNFGNFYRCSMLFHLFHFILTNVLLILSQLSA